MRRWILPNAHTTNTRGIMTYNKEAVDKAIKQNGKIKSKEAKLIHALLKGWR